MSSMPKGWASVPDMPHAYCVIQASVPQFLHLSDGINIIVTVKNPQFT